MNAHTLFPKPCHIVLKPAGAVCNLACDYCYYREKSKLYGDISKQSMTDELLETFIKAYINLHPGSRVLFNWHGGETLLRPLGFYKQAVKFQKKYANGRIIDNCIQTNATLLTDDWCRFFRKHHWLVGVSIDGPKNCHDKYRKNRSGKGTFDKVIHGIQLLKKHGVEWNGMAAINRFNADYPLKIYQFFKELECRYIQFSPVVERLTTYSDGRCIASPTDTGESIQLAAFSVTAKQWGNFLCTLFDQWVKTDIGNYYIQLFDSTLANWMGDPPGVCTLAPTCGHTGVMEFNGDIYTCDHFVFPEYKLGNLHQQSLAKIMYSTQLDTFGKMKRDSLPRQCHQCRWLFACNGECPKNRFIQTADGEDGLNYLCSGYRQFFQHVAPYMDFMRRELVNRRPAANLMVAIKNGVFNLNQALNDTTNTL